MTANCWSSCWRRFKDEINPAGPTYAVLGPEAEGWVQLSRFGTVMSKTNALTAALKEARLAEAARFDAIQRVHDARVLRLEALRDVLLPEITGNPNLRELIEINVQDSDVPRLWIDLITHVEMEPDPRSYRLVQAFEHGRETLFETPKVELMKRQLLRHIAHRTVVLDRALTGKMPLNEPREKIYGFIELVYVWLSGIAFGALGLLAYAMASGIYK